MIIRILLCLIPLCLGIGTVVSEAIVKESDLLSRWSFDEGNGTTSVDMTGSGVNAILEGAGWGVDLNAMSRSSLDLSNGSSYARVPAHPNLQARVNFSIMLWFKSNGLPSDYSQLLSKRDGMLSPYFIQVEPGGAQIKSIFRFFADYVDNGSFAINQFQWHLLTSTYDGERLKTYIDGVLSGSILNSNSVYVENGDLGIGGSPDGSNIFNGWIDDVRLYEIALTARDIENAYGGGFGDFGPSVDINVSRASNASPIPVVLTFRDSSNNLVNVNDLNESNESTDFLLSGGVISNFIKDSNSTYRFDIIPDRNPQRIFLTLNAGAAVDSLGDYSQQQSITISYNKKVTRSDYLVGWWSFDDANGTLVPDQSGGDASAKLMGTASIDTSSPKLGNGALLLDGSNSWAEVGSLMTPSKTTRHNDLIGWWKFDEGLGSSSIDSVTNLSNAGLLDGASFSVTEKKFGDSSLHLPQGSTGAKVRLTPALDLGGTTTVATFSISTWYKNLYPTGNWRTLSRGLTNGHHLIVSDVSNRVGVFANGNGDWRDSGEFDLEADGLWHQIVLVSDGVTSKFYLDGAYQGDSDRPTGQNIYTLGNYDGGGQRFAEYLDDFRVYGVALTDFEVEMLYREAEGAPLDVGVGSYSISAWVKPSAIKATPEYNFAFGWYEGGGGEYMQAKLGQGTTVDYNSLSLLNPGDSLQSSVMPGGVTERLFNGSYDDNQLDDIDGKGYRFGETIPNNQVTRTADANFSVLTAFPTSDPPPDSILWEQGGAGTGSFVGFNGGHLRIRIGSGASAHVAPASSTGNMALLDIPYAELASKGYTDGKLYDLRWEMRLNPGSVRIWVDGDLLGESNTTGSSNLANWSGGDNGGFGKQESSICVGETSTPWPYAIGSSLLYHFGNGFRVRHDYVYQDTNFDIPIDFNGATVNARSLSTGENKSGTGVGTGTDNIGGLWYGKLRIGNSGYLKAGNITFATRSDDGSVLWIDMDEDGDFSKTGLNGSELIVDNKGGHGQINRFGTRFLGRKSPLLMRAGVIEHKGVALAADGYPVSWHATYDQGFSGISSTPMEVGSWYHTVMVVDRETGRIKQYLNGQLSAESSFPAGRQGEISLGDWFIGGMPTFNDRFAGSIDDVRIYSIALNDDEVGKIYNNSSGDMGLVAEFTAPSITDDSNISVDLRFLQFEEPVVVTDLNQSDLIVTGATISTFNDTSDGNFSFTLIPTQGSTEITISLAQGAGQLGGNATLPSNTFIQLVPPVPGKADLVSWWWLDEGKGTSAEDSISGSRGTLSGGVSWSLASTYGTSLSFLNTGDYADLGVPAAGFDTNEFSLNFWFRRNEESFSWSAEQISNVMLSLGNDENCSLQLGTKGSDVEIFLSTIGKSDRASMSANISDGTWHYLSVSYKESISPGNELQIFLDGSSIGSTSIYEGGLSAGLTEKWFLGIARLNSTSDGRFMGNLDDIRLSRKAVSLSEHQSVYNSGNGDLNLGLYASYPSATHSNPISVDLNFTRYGMPWVVDFNESMLGLSNSVFHDINVTTGSSIRVEFNSTVDPGILTVSLPEGIAKDASLTGNQPLSFSIGFGHPVTKLENLVAWWTFDEGNGTTVKDYMSGYVGNLINSMDGNVTFDNSNSKFGYALRFPKNAWVSTNAYPAMMGVGYANPRTISFWMYAEQHESPNGSNRDYETGIYGMGQRSNANGVHRMWGMRGLWDTANYRRIFSQHWGWDPQVYISEGVKNKWMHIAHQYTGTHVKAYVNGSLRNNWAKSNISTGNVFPLQFGRFTEETRTDRTFKGLLDDFRVYNAALGPNDILKIYNSGYGDFEITTSLEVDKVVEGNPNTGRIMFFRGGNLVDVNDFSEAEGDLWVSGGSIIPNSINRIGVGTYAFEFSLDQDNLVSNIWINSGSVTDDYNQTNVPPAGRANNSESTRKMYRAVTRGEDLLAWWPFDTEVVNGTFAVSKTAGSQVISLFDSSISLQGRYGQGVRFRKDQSDARIRVENNGIDLGNSWTLAVWAKNLFPPRASGRSTLFRGQGKQSNREYDRYLTVRGSDRMVSFFDGDDANGDNRYRSSGYALDPLSRVGWHHYTVVGKSSQTRFFVNGMNVGASDRREQSDVYYIGNSSNNEAFAEFLDDIRIYNVGLEDFEISQIYGGGFGDQFTSVKIDDNSSSDSSPRILRVSFGKDSQPVSVSNINAHNLELNVGEIIDFNSTDANSSYIVSINPDFNHTHNVINVPSMPVKFNNLSLWLDASDSVFSNVTLWLDANDTSTISTVTGSTDIETWTNKVDSTVKMHGHATNKPANGDSINGLNAIQFAKRSDNNMEHMFAKKNGTTNWNPAGINGTVSGKVQDVAIFLSARLDTIRRSTFAFGMGWGDHFPWENGQVFWNYSDARANVSIGSNGSTMVLALCYSKTNGKQEIFLNGTSILDKPRTNDYGTGEMSWFTFPSSAAQDGTWGTEWTVGEIIALKGVVPDSVRQGIEGYLSHKWGLDALLPTSHPFKSSSVGDLTNVFWKDKSQKKNHAVQVGNSTLLNADQNGLSVMNYTGTTGESHWFSMINDIRTVFWVVSEDASVPNSDFRSLLGDTTKQPDWHTNAGNIWGATGGDANVYNGYTRLNGAIIDGKSTAKPNSLSIISLRTLGNVQSDNFSNDRNIASQSWHGKLAELLIYNEALSDNEIKKVEGYLAHKWDLTGNLDSGHPYMAQSVVTVGEQFFYDSNLSIENFRYDFLSHERVYKDSDLLSRWRFEEAGQQDGKTVIRDVAVGRNDGFLEGNAQLGSGMFGSGLVLDGTGDYFDIPHFRGLFEDNNFTLSVWVYLNNLGVDNDQQDAAIFSTNGNDLNTMLFWYDVNSVGNANRSFSFNLGPTGINLNRLNAPDSLAVQDFWQHLVAVVSDSQHSIYLNGEEIARSDFAGTSQIHIEGNSVRLGGWDDSVNQDFSGVLDEVRIYQSAFAPNEVAVLYGNGIGDLGIVPTIVVDSNNSASTLSARVDFYQFGQAVAVNGFVQSDIQISGGLVSGFTPNGNGYIFTITPSSHPSRIIVTIPSNSASQGGIGSSAVTQEINHHSELVGGDSLTLWYPFEESNETVLDFSGARIDGVLTGGQHIPGKFGQSLALSTTDHVIANAESLSLSSSFTLSVWAKVLDDAQGVLVRSGQIRLQYHDDNTIRGAIYTGGSWKEVKARSEPGSWTHYVLTYDGSELKLFSNGSLLETLAASGYLNWGDGANHNLYLGKYGTVGWESKCEIDDLRIYKNALSTYQVSDLYGSGTG